MIVIVDTSAFISILTDEPDRDRFVDVIGRHECLMSAGSWVEVGVVVARRFRFIDDRRPVELRDRLGITIVPTTAEEAGIGHRAYREYGQTSESLAQLNFGDCFAYALAKTRRAPLLFKGKDFTHTDIVSALPNPRE